MPFKDEDLVMVSALQHFIYCPRQCALIHIEQVWDENIFTLRGNRAHSRVDTPKSEIRDEQRYEYALPIWSEQLGLIGRADAVVFESDEIVYPIEHKVGKRKAREADAVQLCAQAICLEEMLGVSIPKGYLYYGKTRRRKEVSFTPTLRQTVVDTTLAIREMIHTQRLPSPEADARCTYCSLIETCMPFVIQNLEQHSASQNP